MKAKWIITAVSSAIFFGGNLLTSLRDPWFQSLKRPDWLTFEFLIPFIWIVIWVCVTLSAINIWEAPIKRSHAWVLMALYIAVGVFTSAYSPVVVALKSLAGGLVVGGLASLGVYILAISTWSISKKAALLLLPYMLWGPFGTYLTWLLIRLNY